MCCLKEKETVEFDLLKLREEKEIFIEEKNILKEKFENLQSHLDEKTQFYQSKIQKLEQNIQKLKSLFSLDYARRVFVWFQTHWQTQNIHVKSKNQHMKNTLTQ